MSHLHRVLHPKPTICCDAIKSAQLSFQMAIISNANVRHRIKRSIGLCGLAAICGWSLSIVFLLGCGEDLADAIVPVTAWRIGRHAEPNHPLIRTWANEVVTVTQVPREQVAVAEQAVWHLVKYWDAYDTWGSNSCIPTLDEMIALAQLKGWSTLRGNCVSQSIALCSLLRALGFNANIHASPVHAWVTCEVDGQTQNLLFPVMGETTDNANLPRRTLSGAALAAACRLGANFRGQFEQINLPSETERPIPYFSNPFILTLIVPILVGWLFVFRRWDYATAPKAQQKRASSQLPGGLLEPAAD